MARTIVAIYPERQEAEQAAAELQQANVASEAVRNGQPSPGEEGFVIAATCDEGVLDVVMQILNRHRPSTIDQHTQGYFDAGDRAIARNIPTFHVQQSIDESLGREDGATDEGRRVDRSYH